MKQVRNTAFSILCLLAVLFAAGCGGGGGGTPPPPVPLPQSGVEIGQITGFGSVIVNGTEFQAKDTVQNRIKLPFDNFTSATLQPGVKPEGKLRTGMIVTVKWSRDVAQNQVYENIEFWPELRGPVDDTTPFASTGTTFKVMGRTVQMETGTVFDGIRDFAELKNEVEVQLHRPELEISGILDDSGVLHAT